MLCRAIKHFVRRFIMQMRKSKFRDGLIVIANHHEFGKGKGADAWGTDWIVPVAEEFEWHFFDSTNSGNQYITTKLTDYILFFIPFSYAEYVYELPGGTYKPNTLTTKEVVELIDLLDHWNQHTDIIYIDHNYSQIDFRYNSGQSLIYTFGNNDYDFMRTK